MGFPGFRSLFVLVTLFVLVGCGQDQPVAPYTSGNPNQGQLNPNGQPPPGQQGQPGQQNPDGPVVAPQVDNNPILQPSGANTPPPANNPGAGLQDPRIVNRPTPPPAQQPQVSQQLFNKMVADLETLRCPRTGRDLFSRVGAVEQATWMVARNISMDEWKRTLSYFQVLTIRDGGERWAFDGRYQVKVTNAIYNRVQRFDTLVFDQVYRQKQGRFCGYDAVNATFRFMEIPLDVLAL